MSQRVTSPTTTTTVALTPIARVVRSVIQIVIAVGASVPIVIASSGLTGVEIAKVEGIVASAVAVVVTIQNLLEHYGIIPVAGGTDAAHPSQGADQ